MEKTVIVGLDIGTTKIACFVGSKNEHGKIEVISMGKSESLGVVRGEVQNIDKTVEAIKKAVAEAQERVEGELTIASVYVGIAGQHIKSLQHRGGITRLNADEDEIRQDDVDRLIEDVNRLVMQPGQKIITVLPQEYIVDGTHGIKDPIGVPGVKVEAQCHIICGNVQAVKNINKCVVKAGLEVKDIILEPIASSESVLSEEEKEGGVVLVDIGGGTTDLAIFYEGIIRHTAVIPFGGDIITKDIKEGCQILEKFAEELKKQYGSAIASESKSNVVIGIPAFKGKSPKEIKQQNLAHIIEARVSEIIDSIYYEIVNSGYESKLGVGIVITGGGSQLKHLKQLFEYKTGLDARIGLPTEHLASTNEIDVYASPMYSTGIGLVLKGFESIERKGGENAVAPGGGVNPGVGDGDGKGRFFSEFFKNSSAVAQKFFEVEDKKK